MKKRVDDLSPGEREERSRIEKDDLEGRPKYYNHSGLRVSEWSHALDVFIVALMEFDELKRSKGE
jgi:hypothetical protein